jgi:hypothetical protein
MLGKYYYYLLVNRSNGAEKSKPARLKKVQACGTGHLEIQSTKLTVDVDR